MKKLLTILFALLILVGCSQKGYSELSDGSEVIFKGPDTTYTRQDLYKSLKVASEEDIDADILKKIAINLNVDLSDVEKEAQETLEMYKSMGYEQMITAYYGSEEAFIEMYKSNGIMTKLSEVYVNDNYDKLVADDKPVKMQLVNFDSQDTANKFVEEVNGGKKFEDAAAENGYTNECNVQVYLDSDETLPINVKSYLNETVSTGLSSIIIVTNTSTDADGNLTTVDSYYVLNIISKNPDEFKEDYVQARITASGEEGVKEYLFSTHDIKFYDQDIYEIMKARYEVLK